MVIFLLECDKYLSVCDNRLSNINGLFYTALSFSSNPCPHYVHFRRVNMIYNTCLETMSSRCVIGYEYHSQRYIVLLYINNVFMLYLGCQHQVQKESGTIFTSHFPNYQYCSWSITVSQGFVVSLTITSINIPSCDENYINIHDGADDTAPILLSLCGSNATAGTRLRSTGNIMFITLKSGLNFQNMHFQANFTSTTTYSGMWVIFFLFPSTFNQKK